MRRRVKDGLKVAAEDVALPAVKVGIPVKSGKLKSSLTARATQSRGYIRAGSARVPYAGLLEFGGTVKEPIRPRAKKALLVNGQPRANVKKPRKYKARKFLRGPIFKKQPQIRDAIEVNVMKAFEGLDTQTSASTGGAPAMPGMGGLA